MKRNIGKKGLWEKYPKENILNQWPDESATDSVPGLQVRTKISGLTVRPQSYSCLSLKLYELWYNTSYSLQNEKERDPIQNSFKLCR